MPEAKYQGRPICYIKFSQVGGCEQGLALETTLAVDCAVEVAVLLALWLVLVQLRLVLLNVHWTRSWWRGEDTESLERLLCSVLTSVIDVLAIVPEASRELSALYRDHATPSSAAA